MEPGRLNRLQFVRGGSAREYAVGRCETVTDTSLAELRTNLLRTIKELDGVAILCALIAT